MAMNTYELLDLVYESDPDHISANFSLGSQSRGNIRENLRQVKEEQEDDEAEWYVEAEQYDTLNVVFTAEYEDYIVKGVIEGRTEHLEHL